MLLRILIVTSFVVVRKAKGIPAPARVADPYYLLRDIYQGPVDTSDPSLDRLVGVLGSHEVDHVDFSDPAWQVVSQLLVPVAVQGFQSMNLRPHQYYSYMDNKTPVQPPVTSTSPPTSTAVTEPHEEVTTLPEGLDLLSKPIPSSILTSLGFNESVPLLFESQKEPKGEKNSSMATMGGGAGIIENSILKEHQNIFNGSFMDITSSSYPSITSISGNAVTESTSGLVTESSPLPSFPTEHPDVTAGHNTAETTLETTTFMDNKYGVTMGNYENELSIDTALDIANVSESSTVISNLGADFGADIDMTTLSPGDMDVTTLYSNLSEETTEMNYNTNDIITESLQTATYIGGIADENTKSYEEMNYETTENSMITHYEIVWDVTTSHEETKGVTNYDYGMTDETTDVATHYSDTTEEATGMDYTVDNMTSESFQTAAYFNDLADMSTESYGEMIGMTTENSIITHYEDVWDVTTDLTTHYEDDLTSYHHDEPTYITNDYNDIDGTTHTTTSYEEISADIKNVTTHYEDDEYETTDSPNHEVMADETTNMAPTYHDISNSNDMTTLYEDVTEKTIDISSNNDYTYGVFDLADRYNAIGEEDLSDFVTENTINMTSNYEETEETFEITPTYNGISEPSDVSTLYEGVTENVIYMATQYEDADETFDRTTHYNDINERNDMASPYEGVTDKSVDAATYEYTDNYDSINEGDSMSTPSVGVTDKSIDTATYHAGTDETTEMTTDYDDVSEPTDGMEEITTHYNDVSEQSLMTTPSLDVAEETTHDEDTDETTDITTRYDAINELGDMATRSEGAKENTFIMATYYEGTMYETTEMTTQGMIHEARDMASLHGESAGESALETHHEVMLADIPLYNIIADDTTESSDMEALYGTGESLVVINDFDVTFTNDSNLTKLKNEVVFEESIFDSINTNKKFTDVHSKSESTHEYAFIGSTTSIPDSSPTIIPPFDSMDSRQGITDEPAGHNNGFTDKMSITSETIETPNVVESSETTALEVSSNSTFKSVTEENSDANNMNSSNVNTTHQRQNEDSPSWPTVEDELPSSLTSPNNPDATQNIILPTEHSVTDQSLLEGKEEALEPLSNTFGPTPSTDRINKEVLNFFFPGPRDPNAPAKGTIVDLFDIRNPLQPLIRPRPPFPDLFGISGPLLRPDLQLVSCEDGNRECIHWARGGGCVCAPGRARRQCEWQLHVQQTCPRSCGLCP